MGTVVVGSIAGDEDMVVLRIRVGRREWGARWDGVGMIGVELSSV